MHRNLHRNRWRRSRRPRAWATEYSNMQIEQLHLLGALTREDEGLISQLLRKMGVDLTAFRSDLTREIAAMPAVTGPGREPDKIYVAPDVDKILTAAEKLAEQMKDDYISVEHIMLSLLQSPNPAAKKLFDRYAITKDSFLSALDERPGQHPGHQRHPRGDL